MLKFSKKPLMIASGCSFTDPDFSSVFHPELDTSWDKWPDIFSKKHGFKVLNVGRSGSGNLRICKSVINAVNKNPNTKLVLVLWSGWDRFSIYGSKWCPIAMCCKKDEMTQREELKFLSRRPKTKLMYELSEIILKNYINFGEILDDTMFNMWLLKDFLEKRNIKYVFAQGVKPIQFSYFDKNYISDVIHPKLKDFLDHQYHDDLDIENFYGWPLIEQLGGINSETIIDNNPDEWKISNIDGHPNAKGQEEIAKIFSKTYEEIYT